MRILRGIAVTLGWVGVLVLVAGLAVLTLPRQLGVSMITPIAQVVAFRGAVMVVTAAAAVLLGLVWLIALLWRRRPRPSRAGAGAAGAGVDSGRRRPAALFAMTTTLLVALLSSVVVHVTVLGLRGYESSERVSVEQLQSTPIGANDFTVVSLNSQWDAVEPSFIATLAQSAKAKMIALPESERPHAQAVADALAAAGQPGWQVFATSSPWPNAMLVSPDAGRYQLVDRGHRGLVIAEPVGHEGPLLVTVHAMPPPSMAPWAPNHTWVSMWWKRTVNEASQVIRDEPKIIAAGDFNATLDHAALNPGSDAMRVGTSAWGTWPSSAPAWMGARIDHVFAKPYDATRGTWVIDAPGSDHRAVVVRLTFMR